MIITVTVKEDKDLPIWDLEKFVVETDFPGPIVFCGPDKKECIEACKGAALCAVGMWSVVPNQIEFKIIDED